MKTRTTPAAGGIFLAIGALAGAVWGIRNGQPSAGLLIGLGCGALLALLIALVTRR